MTAYLLDVSILIALLSRKQDHHRRASAWFESEGHTSWLTCPTIQNDAIRIMRAAGFSNVTVTPGSMIERVASLTAVGNHRFIPDDVSLLDDSLVNPSRLLASKQVTDIYPRRWPHTTAQRSRHLIAGSPPTLSSTGRPA